MLIVKHKLTWTTKKNRNTDLEMITGIIDHCLVNLYKTNLKTDGPFYDMTVHLQVQAATAKPELKVL